MDKFMLNITASSGEFYQGDCESLILPTGDGVYGVQAGHSPVLVALHMGMLHFTVNGETVTTYLADVDDLGDYVGETEVISDGVFLESFYRSAPYFDLDIDGITNLDA